MAFEEEKKESFVDKLNSSIADFVGNLFGEDAKKSVMDAQEKVKDISAQTVTKLVEFSDSILESLKLNENEQVMKARDSIQDMLKQEGLLKEPEEEAEQL